MGRDCCRRTPLPVCLHRVLQRNRTPTQPAASTAAHAVPRPHTLDLACCKHEHRPTPYVSHVHDSHHPLRITTATVPLLCAMSCLAEMPGNNHRRPWLQAPAVARYSTNLVVCHTTHPRNRVMNVSGFSGRVWNDPQQAPAPWGTLAGRNARHLRTHQLPACSPQKSVRTNLFHSTTRRCTQVGQVVFDIQFLVSMFSSARATNKHALPKEATLKTLLVPGLCRFG